MAKLTRYTQKIFGSSAGSNQIAEFGSLANGSPARYSGSTITPAIVQTLSNYLTGWFGAVIGGNSPAIEDMNAVQYLYSYQLAYLMQAGIAEYDSATTYYIGSLARSTNGTTYYSLTDNNTGNALTDTTNWATQAATPAYNLCANGFFDYWQRGSSDITVAQSANTYMADRWMIRNSLGSASVITGHQTTGSVAGSTYGMQLKITTAPTSSIFAPGCELVQSLETVDSVKYIGRPVTIVAYVKALGNANSVAMNLWYNTTEGKVGVNTSTSAGGSSFVISSGSFTKCVLQNIIVPSAMTTSGNFGIGIRMDGASSGNVYALNNGFIVEQMAILPGSYSHPTRAGNDAAEELAICQRYYEKTYDVDVAPATSTAVGMFETRAGTTSFTTPISFKATKRVNSYTITTYTQTGTSGNWKNSGVNTATSTSNAGQSSVCISTATSTEGAAINGHWVCDAEIT